MTHRRFVSPIFVAGPVQAHPRLSLVSAAEPWIAGPSPGMTGGAVSGSSTSIFPAAGITTPCPPWSSLFLRVEMPFSPTRQTLHYARARHLPEIIVLTGTDPG
jgi:hypothetical protein